MEKKTKLIGAGVAFLFSLLLFWIFCLNRVGLNEVGVAHNLSDGKTEVQGIGWHVTAPWVKVISVYDYAFVVSVTESNYVSVNERFLPKYVKLKIKKEYIEEFIQDIGFNYLPKEKQIAIMRAGYFQETAPKWLEILEK